MGAVSAFTDRNLSLPTSEKLLLADVEAFASCWWWSSCFLLGWWWSSCFLMVVGQLLLAWMVVEHLLLDGGGAVASCLDGVQLC